MRKYTVEFHYPSSARPVQRGWKEGYDLHEAIETIIEYHHGKGREVGTIRFDNKEVVPEHRHAIIEIANHWARIQMLEKKIKPDEARRRRTAARHK